MRISKKLLIIGGLCVVVLAGTLGGFAIAAADDENSANSTEPQFNQANLMEKVAETYEKNTGTAIDSAALQKAFEEAGAAIRTDARDQFLQKLVDDGKITQEQADSWKAWLDARPSNVFSDEFKTWMKSRPDIPGMFGDNKPGNMMPFGGIHRGFGKMGGGFGEGLRDCLPAFNN
jgi:hypothetical protein